MGGRPDGGRQAADGRPRLARDRARSAPSQLAPPPELGRGGAGRPANATADRSCRGGVARAGSRPRPAVPRHPAPVRRSSGRPMHGDTLGPAEAEFLAASEEALVQATARSERGGAALPSGPTARRLGAGGADRRGGGSLGDRLLRALRGQIAVRTGARDPGEAARGLRSADRDRARGRGIREDRGRSDRRPGGAGGREPDARGPVRALGPASCRSEMPRPSRSAPTGLSSSRGTATGRSQLGARRGRRLATQRRGAHRWRSRRWTSHPTVAG